MNTNPNAKVVLCFGDSNTYGQHPDKTHRYPADVRWTRQLQKLLGDDFYVIEEGLGGRTTDLGSQDPKKPGRNGREYFVPCLQSHQPLDIVIIMLGTNDLKIKYQRSADEIADALSGFIADVREYCQDSDGKEPRIILVSPTILNDKAPKFAELYTNKYNASSAEESKKLATTISQLAERQSCIFIDSATVAENGDEGVHWDKPSHSRFAETISKKVKELA